MKNSEFLSAIYGETAGTYGWSTSFRADPGEVDGSAWAGSAWRGSPAQRTLIDARGNDNNFFCVALMRGDKPRRTKDQFERLAVLLADDADPNELMGSPSYVIETSSGNHQIGVLLDPEDSDTRNRDLVDAVLQKMVAAKLMKADASGNNIVRYGRLPAGSNTKKKANTFSVRVHSCDLQSVYSLDDAAAMFGIDLSELRPIGKPPLKGGTIALDSGRPAVDMVSQWKALLDPEPADRSYHDPLLKITATMRGAGMEAGAVVNMVRSVMLAIKPEDPHEFERWHQRYGSELARMVGGAEKFAPPPPREAHSLLETHAQVVESAKNATWLVKGLVPADSMGMLFGPSGAFKSFVALDLCLHLVHGMDWAGKRTKGGPVVYMAAEGGSGLAKRVTAWHEHNGMAEVPDAFQYCRVPLLMSDPSEVASLRAAITALPIEPCLVVVDTLSQTYNGDENSASDVASYLRLINSEIRATFKCSVLVVHHTGHSAAERPRGSSALTSNLDYLLGAYRPEGGRMEARLGVHKMKDGEKLDDHYFEMKRLVMGRDEDGDEVSSLVADYVEVADEIAANMAKSKYAALIMSLVHAGKPVTEDEMLEAASDMTKNRKTARSGLSYARTHLENGRIIRSLGNGLWIKT